MHSFAFPIAFVLIMAKGLGRGVLSKVHQYATRRQHLTSNCYASATRIELLHRSQIITVSSIKWQELEQHYSVQTVGSETKMHGLVPGCNIIRFPFLISRKHWSPPRPHFRGGWSFPLGENGRNAKLIFYFYLLVAVRLWMNAAAAYCLACFYGVNREKFVVCY